MRVLRDLAIGLVAGFAIPLVASYSGAHNLRRYEWTGTAIAALVLVGAVAGERVYRSLRPDRRELDRRLAVIAELRRQYRADYMTAHGDGIPHDVMMGTMQVPVEWMNERLSRRGERWQIDAAGGFTRRSLPRASGSGFGVLRR